ncbi:hypothetical protein AAC978_14230 [Desulfitobacterium sp. THU1]|uniref:hypothetical protein n=1 Tax=Desulfitobacterium sp. THU1 TaxID=3138072 RepID=UPI00311DD85B
MRIRNSPVDCFAEAETTKNTLPLRVLFATLRPETNTPAVWILLSQVLRSVMHFVSRFHFSEKQKDHLQ